MKEKMDYTSLKAREQIYKQRLIDAGLLSPDRPPSLEEEIEALEQDFYKEVKVKLKRLTDKTGRNYRAAIDLNTNYGGEGKITKLDIEPFKVNDTYQTNAVKSLVEYCWKVGEYKNRNHVREWVVKQLSKC